MWRQTTPNRERDPPHSGNQLLHLLSFFRALIARTFWQWSIFFPQAISRVNNWQQTDFFCFLKYINFVLHWPKCGSIKFSILCLLLLLVLVRIDFMSKFIPGEWNAHRRGMDISKQQGGVQWPVWMEQRCVERRLFKEKSGQPWMFVYSFSAVITGMLLVGPIVPRGNILTQPGPSARRFVFTLSIQKVQQPNTEICTKAAETWSSFSSGSVLCHSCFHSLM